MRFSDLKYNKGVAGLTILLSLVTMLFVIGLLIMIFALMGTGMRDATYKVTTVTVSNETNAFINDTGYTLSNASVRNFRNVAITLAYNSTDVGLIASGNYTVSSAGVVTNVTAWKTSNASISYTYVWDADTIATDVMNDTVGGISNVTDWFPIFIVIGAMVVLILLTVIIITAIRSSGLMGGGTTPIGQQNVGSA